MRCRVPSSPELMTWVIFEYLFYLTLGKRIDDIEKSVTDLMNDLGLSDEEGEKQGK